MAYKPSIAGVPGIRSGHSDEYRRSCRAQGPDLVHARRPCMSVKLLGLLQLPKLAVMQRVYGRKGRRTTREPRISETKAPSDTDDNDLSSPGRRKRRKINIEAGSVMPRPAGSPSRCPQMTLPMSSTGLDDLHDQTQEDMSQESYTDLRNRWGVDKSEDDPLPFRTGALPVSTAEAHFKRVVSIIPDITELRNKGESRRFVDEVGYLFEGLEIPSAIALRRASALEIVDKLCDSDFNRRAKAFDFYVLTWDKLSTSRGGIFDAILSFFAALAARDPHTLGDVSRRPDFVDTLVDILVSLRDKTDVLSLAAANARVTDFKSCGISRTEILVVGIHIFPLKKLSDMVSKELYEGSQSQVGIDWTPSVRFLISHTLAVLPTALAVRHLDPILANLETELSLVEPRITAYLSGLPLLPVPSELCSVALSLEHLESCLRLVDSFLLGQWSAPDLEDDRAAVFRAACVDGLASKFLSLCVLSEVQLRESASEDERILAFVESSMKTLLQRMSSFVVIRPSFLAY
ncbi:hypothetical protein F5141DRAFT_1204095 [Pisolithus sp. B1]|nr:hypothetical protein F5141DRAFT_1204095 [Pisolithus sp. B1]